MLVHSFKPTYYTCILVVDLPKPHRSTEWGCCSHVPSQVSHILEANQLRPKFVFYESVYRRPEEYKKKVAEYVKKYATEDALRETDKVRKSQGHCRIIISFYLSGGSLIIVRELDVRFF